MRFYPALQLTLLVPDLCAGLSKMVKSPNWPLMASGDLTFDLTKNDAIICVFFTLFRISLTACLYVAQELG